MQRLAAAAGAIKVAMLAVSGAFHTSLMQPARDALVQVCSCCALQLMQLMQLLWYQA